MRVLLVEDDHDLAVSLADGLARDGYAVERAGDGMSALAAAAARAPDLVILDRDLPVLSGDAVCEALAGTGARILMLTAAGSVRDRVVGLDLGADDYLVKPFAYVELLARLRALLRRGGPDDGTVLERSGIRLDTVRRTAERDGTPLRLTPKELAVLEVLLAADGGWVTVDALLQGAWDDPLGRDRSVVKVAVRALRTRLGPPPVVESAVGLGYRVA